MVPHYMQSVSVTVYREYSETDQMEVHCTGLSSIRHEHEPKTTVSFLVMVYSSGSEVEHKSDDMARLLYLSFEPHHNLTGDT